MFSYLYMITEYVVVAIAAAAAAATTLDIQNGYKASATAATAAKGRLQGYYEYPY